MKRKYVQTIIGLAMSVCVMGAIPAASFAAEEPAATEVAVETEMTTETEALESESESKKENDFVEGSAVLADYEYKKGNLTKDGWMSESLKMKYDLGKGYTMGLDQNDELEKHYLRNGEDKQIATSEMVVLGKDGNYLQMMAEVNPNGETAEDILTRFAEQEKFELTSKTKEMDVAGKTFQYCTGVVEKERYLIGVCDEGENIVLAMKLKYANADAREDILKGFAEIKDEDTSLEAETSSDAAEAETEVSATEVETETSTESVE